MKTYLVNINDSKFKFCVLCSSDTTSITEMVMLLVVTYLKIQILHFNVFKKSSLFDLIPLLKMFKAF